MPKRKRVALWTMGSLTGLLALWMVWPAAEPSDHELEVKPVAPVAASMTTSGANAVSSVQTRMATGDAIPAGSRSPNEAQSWRELYAEPDLYAQLLKLHQTRRTGDFAAVRALNIVCIEATLWSYYPGRDPLARADVNHPDHANRLAARELVLARCGYIRNNSGAAMLLKAADGDTEGSKYMEAVLALQDPRGKSAANVQSALAEVVRHGHAEELLKFYRHAMGMPRWRDLFLHSPDTADDVARAAGIAGLRLTAPGGGALAERDIRLAFGCFMHGQCSYRYDDLSDINDVERRARILRIAASLEATLNAPDPVAALFKKR